MLVHPSSHVSRGLAYIFIGESPYWKLDILVFKVALKNQMTKSLISLLFTPLTMTSGES